MRNVGIKQLLKACPLIAALLLPGCGGEKTTEPSGAKISAEEAQAIAKEAYIYGLPIVMGYKSMYAYAIDESSPEYKGPFDEVACDARLFTPDDKAIVTPNADTPYCMFWMDLREEPLVITVPEMEPERFYHWQLVDLYTHNFAYVGTLTTGNGSAKYLVTGPNWTGDKPDGVIDVIRSETDFVFNIIRTQLLGQDDLERVKEIQASYDVQSLRVYMGGTVPPDASALNFPEWVEGAQFDERCFDYLDFLLSLVEPVEEEQPLMKRLARIGLGSNKPFEIASLSPDIQEALKEGVKLGFAEIEQSLEEFVSDPLGSAKSFGTRQFLMESAATNYGFDHHYLLRAGAAHIGLYGNSGSEAIYPTYFVDNEGEPLNTAAHSYRIRFPAGQLPPAKAFWSLSMYDGVSQLFIHNQLDRYLLNSTMLERFRKEADGSIVFYIQKDSPRKNLEPNWLPAPDGPFYMVLRLYGPELEALEGKWTPPDLQKAK